MPSSRSARRALRPPRRLLLLAVAVAVTAALLPATPAQAASTVDTERRISELVNEHRRRAGAPPATVDLWLLAGARRWAGHCARVGHLSHDPDLGGAAPPGSDAWAEIVGMTTGGSAAERIVRGFLDSPPHRRILLRPSYDRIGVGVARGGGAVWATIRFVSGAGAGDPAAGVVATAEAAERLFAPGKARHAAIVRDDAFPGALAAGPLVGGSGPLLFSPTGPALHPRVRTALERTLPRGRTVFLIGSDRVVRPGVARELSDVGWNVVRLGGDDRVATAAAVAGRLAKGRGGRVDHVLLATAANWPDAAAGGAYGAETGSPVLLVHRDRLPAPTREALRRLRPRRVTVLGSSGVVSDGVARAAGATDRIGGRDRVETSPEGGRRALERAGRPRGRPGAGRRSRLHVGAGGRTRSGAARRAAAARTPARGSRAGAGAAARRRRPGADAHAAPAGAGGLLGAAGLRPSSRRRLTART